MRILKCIKVLFQEICKKNASFQEILFILQRMILVNDLKCTKELIGWTVLHLLLFNDWRSTCQSEITQSINVSRIAQTVRSSHHLDRTPEW